MTRGTIYILLPNDRVMASCEFNGDMYQGGHYEEVIERLVRVNNDDDFMKEVIEFDAKNHNYFKEGYKEGEEPDIVDVTGDKELEDNYKYFSFRIFDYNQLADIDGNLRLKKMMNIVNYSDYEFIKNCSGEKVALVDSEDVEVELRDGEISTFNYGEYIEMFNPKKETMQEIDTRLALSAR